MEAKEHAGNRQRVSQQQQQLLASKEAAVPAAKPSGPNGEAPSSFTLADMLPGQPQGERRKPSAWGAPGGGTYEETAADLEGGADEEGIEEVCFGILSNCCCG